MATSISSCRQFGPAGASASAHHLRPNSGSVAKSGAKLVAVRDRVATSGLQLGAPGSRKISPCLKATPEDDRYVQTEDAVEPMPEEVAEAEETVVESASEPTTETLGEVLRKRRAPAKESDSGAEGALVDIINPYIIGRKSRAVFDDAWSKLSRLSTAGSGGSFMGSMDFYDDGELELEAPQV